MALHLLRLLKNEADDPLFIDHVGDPTSDAALFVEGSEGFGAVMCRKPTYGLESYTTVLGKGALSRRHVDADTPYLGVELLEFLIMLLEFLELPLSTTGEGSDVKGNDEVLFALEVADIHGLSVRSPEADVQCGLPDLR